MKKMLIAALGLSGLLASCSNVTVTIPEITPGTGTSSSLSLTEIKEFETSYKLTQDVTDQTGQVLKAGTSVICDDAETTMFVDVAWTGYLSKLYIQFKGLTTEQYKNVAPYTVNAGSGSGTAKYTFAPGMAPLSIQPQSIIVNGKVTRLGNTYVRIQGVDQNGYNSNILESAAAIPVLKCNN